MNFLDELEANNLEVFKSTSEYEAQAVDSTEQELEIAFEKWLEKQHTGICGNLYHSQCVDCYGICPLQP